MLAMTIIAWISTPTLAAPPYRLELRQEINAGELHIPVGKSQILRSPKPLKQLIVGDPEIADIKLLGAREILILGKSPGTTNLALRDNKKRIVALIDVVVGYDLLAIKRKLHEMLPNEHRIEVRSANDTVILSGEASSAGAMTTALSIARSYVPLDDKLANHLQVGGGQQVMLEVTIAEVFRSSINDMGVQTRIEGGEFTFSTFGGAGALASTTVFGTAGLLTSAILNTFNATLSALESRNLARILAEPKLVALSGHEASFLSGGEFPVQVLGDNNTVGIEFKPFGIGVKFTPTVLHSAKISLQLNTEVSNTREFLEGTGITARRASTTVELGDGESFMIAGLLSDDMDNLINKFPGLGDVPVLGPLFRSTEFQRNETELVIAITPRLVKPISPGALALPTDNMIPPSDIDQYYHGRVQGQASDSILTGGLDGPSGHQL